MGKKSKAKGDRGELQVVHLFTDRGYVAHRTAQVDGSLSADVIVKGLDRFHFEVKLHARIGAFRFWDQALEDAGAEKTPVLFMREDAAPWLVAVDSEFFFWLLYHAFPPPV